MRKSPTSQTYVCLPCLLKSATPRSAVTTRLAENSSRSFASLPSQNAVKRPGTAGPPPVTSTKGTRRSITSNTSTTSEPVRLTPQQASLLGQYYNVKRMLKDGLAQIPEAKANPDNVPIETVFATFPPSRSEAPCLRILEQVYAGKHYGDVQKDMEKVSIYRRPSMRDVIDEDSIRILTQWGLLDSGKKPIKVSEPSQPATSQAAEEGTVQTPTALTISKLRARDRLAVRKPKSRQVPSLQIRKQIGKLPIRQTTSEPKARFIPTSPVRAEPSRGLPREAPSVAIPAPSTAKSLNGAFIPRTAIEKEATLPVPKLSFDLSRVLFNPGVYHLQDPRSRVYNFDPYLEKIMPVSEFNFDALNPYITSSQDDHLRNVSMKHQKRYIGSSSSMSGVMSHFHFLFSAWRPLDISMLSKRIDGQKNFTVITRAPSGVFLRWRDGVYAVDADKEHDKPNILMMQGKSMEKLLTLEKDDFEKWRKPKAGEPSPALESDPESYHYSACGDFLLRSQLDAWDPRLPGTGMFDLKTRACAGIRMDMANHEIGSGYEIKERFGEWESFDREYFDMMRSAFLKYSLQVRMGRMDGIFVAYHNIERIFGFQYISLAELDTGLHGQSDPTVGDREFKMTVKMMNEIFDLATKEHPEQSLRFVFETREASKTDPLGVMRVFAEPMSEEDIEKVQNTGKARVEEYERNLANGTPQGQSEPVDGQNMGGKSIEAKLSPSTLESNSADVAFLEEVLRQDADTKSPAAQSDRTPTQVACWTIKIHNEVNGRPVIRPQHITSSDQWVVKYTIDRSSDAQAKSLYTSCRNRKTATMGYNLEAKKENFFVQRIRAMSEAGRVWRGEQNEMDAQREKVILYDSE